MSLNLLLFYTERRNTRPFESPAQASSSGLCLTATYMTPFRAQSESRATNSVLEWSAQPVLKVENVKLPSPHTQNDSNTVVRDTQSPLERFCTLSSHQQYGHIAVPHHCGRDFTLVQPFVPVFLPSSLGSTVASARLAKLSPPSNTVPAKCDGIDLRLSCL